MAGLCEGGNEPPSSLKAICNDLTQLPWGPLAFLDNGQMRMRKMGPSDLLKTLDELRFGAVGLNEFCLKYEITKQTFKRHLMGKVKRDLERPANGFVNGRNTALPVAIEEELIAKPSSPPTIIYGTGEATSVTGADHATDWGGEQEQLYFAPDQLTDRPLEIKISETTAGSDLTNSAVPASSAAEETVNAHSESTTSVMSLS
ncbi:hypothetical protein ANN_13089 [Periplaneta americana]|uniref:Uncharacterized protein n=1 Tax=Periplaneta americana TaxID=6978 RepID=A0ABQ8TJE9_PERAM|nr:hypothetical protein ANN_13089 [Periplaneta americana]